MIESSLDFTKLSSQFTEQQKDISVTRTRTMKKLSVSTCLLLTLFIGGFVLRAQNAPPPTNISHVLLISIDGMHSQDLANWVSANPKSTLARLTATGVNYPNAFTTQPSDSIPSTVGIFTGASPALGGMYYDDAWHRAWWKPGSNCTIGSAGTAIDLKNTIDIDPTPALPLAAVSIDPNKLPLDPNNGCLPVFPHNMMRVNTVFEVLSGAGMYTAYSEKRPSYDFLNGPSGVGVQDLYTPEIASYNLLDPTLDLTGIETFDDLRVASVINEINELNHDGTALAPLPALFGMNFQAVNSAKKASTTSGYADSTGTPDAILQGALSYVDNRIGEMLAAFPPGQLKKTAIIITAKHGESPFGNQRTVVPTTGTGSIGSILTAAGITTHKITQKTSALIWLNYGTPPNPAVVTAAAVAALNADPTLAPNLHEVLSFGSADFPFPDPTVDPAVPDIVVVMNNGVNFEPPCPSPCTTPITYAEHGGFGENETHVPLLISNPGWTGLTDTSTVLTRQIAPTVLTLLGLDPTALQAVQIEGTPVLLEF
jgi:hypothetical protein